MNWATKKFFLPKRFPDGLAAMDPFHGATGGNPKELMGINAELSLKGHGEICHNQRCPNRGTNIAIVSLFRTRTKGVSESDGRVRVED